MTKQDVLLWGIKHIAENHGFKSAVDGFEEDDSLCVCIFGGCNVPTLSDVQMLCEDIGIPRDCIESSEFGIDVYLWRDWYTDKGFLLDEYTPSGNEMWKRYAVEIGS